MDSDSDDEIFFGRVTEKEEKIARKLRNRRTEIFKPCAPLFQLRSSESQEGDEPESDNDSKATQIDHTHDLTSNLPPETSGSLFVNEGSTPHLSQCSLESQLEDQEPLFVFTPSYKEVKRNLEFHDQNSEDDFYEILNKRESQNSYTLQSLPASDDDISRQDSLDSSTDCAHPTDSYHEISLKPRTFSSKSIVSEESIDCSSHSSETQHLDHTEHCTQADRYDEETEESLSTSECAKRALLEASVNDEKVFISMRMDAEKIEPRATVDRKSSVAGTTVSDDMLETSAETSVSVPDVVASVPKTDVSGEDCISEMPLTEENSKPKMEVSGGDTVTESNIRGNSVLKTTDSDGCIVSDIKGNEGDIASESVLSQEENLAEEQSDFKGFQEPLSKEKLMHKTEGDGENITEAVPSLGSRMNERLSVKEKAAIGPVGDSYTEKTGTAFGNELQKSSRVRQSYYSSLEVINVNSSNVYGDFLIEEDLPSTVDCGLPCSYRNDLTPCTYISSTSENVGDFPEQENHSGQINEKRASLPMNSSESDAADSALEEPELNQESSIESAYISDEQSTESFKGEDSLIHSKRNKNDEDNFSTCETRCSVSNVSEYKDMKLINQTTPMRKPPVLTAAYTDCLKACDTDISLLEPSHLSNSSAELENVHCTLLATPSIFSSQSPFSQNRIGADSDSNDVDAESRGSGNKAVSQVKDSMASCTPLHHLMSGSSEILKCRSPEYEMMHHLTPYASRKSYDTSIDSENGIQSPSEKFNDTIEEMEMMLKYGIDYGERAKEITSPLDTNKNRSHDDKLEDYNDQICGNKANDPILSSVHKSSIASMISNFHPQLESTRVSSPQEGLPFQRKGSKDMGTLDNEFVHNPSQSGSGPKREPPLKPPRNVHFSNVSPKKYGSSKVSTPSTPKYLSVRSKGGGQQSHVQKNNLSKEGLHASKAATPGSTGKKANELTPKHHTLVKSSLWSPGSRPQTNVSGCMGTPVNLQKSSKLGHLSASTSASTQSVARLQRQSPGIKQSTPVLKKSSSILNGKSVANTGLPPRPTPNKMGKIVLKQTPSQKTKVNFVNKTPSPTIRRNRQHLKQGLSIISPVAKYLKENPPPPLVVNVKPRHKISPKKIQGYSSPKKMSRCMAGSHQADTGKPAHPIQLQASPKVPTDHKSKKDEINNIGGETALSRIQDDLDRLTLKVKGEQNYVKEEEHDETEHLCEEDHILPIIKYFSSVPAVVIDEENKGNKKGCRSREIPTDKQPPIVVKHKGRMKMSKVTFQEGLADSASPKGKRSPTPVNQVISPQRSRPSARSSLMEVSLYESHAIQYTNTLH